MSRAKTNRMKRIFKMQTRKEEQQRVVVANARREVETRREALAAAESQLESATTSGGTLDLASVQFGRLLVESGLRASTHRRALLEESMADLEVEYGKWQAERQRAKSLEKMVDRLSEEAAVQAAKDEEALIEELSLSRRSASHA